MFTPFTFRLIEFSLAFANYAAGTPFSWDRARHRVGMRTPKAGSWLGWAFWIWPSPVEKYAALGLSVFSCLLAILSCTKYFAVARLGFGPGEGLSSVAGLWKLCFLTVTALSTTYMFCCHTRTAQVASVLNGLLQVCERAEARREPRSWRNIRNSRSRADLLFAAMIYSIILGYPIISSVIYLVDCDLHVLDLQALPGCEGILCEIHTLQGLWWESLISDALILGKFTSLLILQSALMAAFAGAIVVFAVTMYPLLFFVLEILEQMATVLTTVSIAKSPRWRTEDGALIMDTLQDYRALQLLVSNLNSTNFARYALGGAFLPCVVLFCVTANIAVHRRAPGVMILGAICIVSLLAMHYAVFYSRFWRITEASAAVLRDLRVRAKQMQGSGRKGLGRGHEQQRELLLQAARPLKFEFGFVGRFDKTAYVFIGRLLVEYTIQSLLL